jgi:hypothetical protein
MTEIVIEYTRHNLLPRDVDAALMTQPPSHGKLRTPGNNQPLACISSIVSNTSKILNSWNTSMPVSPLRLAGVMATASGSSGAVGR